MTQNGGSLIGRVVTIANKPIKDAVILFTADSPTHNDIAARTNDKGEFKFHGLSPGDYRVLVNAEGLPRKVFRVHVSEGKATTVRVSLD